MTDDTPLLAPDDARALAASLRAVLEATRAGLGDDRGSALVAAVTDHLGVDLAGVVSVSAGFPEWEHATLQRAVDAYLAAHGPPAPWFGAAGSGRHHEDTLSMLVGARHHAGYELGAVDLSTAAVGPDEVVEVVRHGLVASRAPDGTPVVLGVRGGQEHMDPQCRFEVLAAERGTAAAVRQEVEDLMRAYDVLRGQVLAFGVSEHRGNELLTFLPRPALRPDDVVLPEGLLQEVEDHVVGTAAHGARLLAAGQHLKRGLLLHGPPGTGKTHTVRYLMGRLPGATVVVLTGPAMRFIPVAAALARRLQPSVVVVEDVDLVAMDRSFSPDGNPLLFSLLDAMDGIGADADVTFVLTTNRAADLEQALVDRPGRVDLAVEVPRPDAAGRRRLLQLYAGATLAPGDLEPVVTRTDGVTASFVKELVRRAVLGALRRGGDGPPVVGVDDLGAALDAMTGERSALTRSLLGVRDARRGEGGR